MRRRLLLALSASIFFLISAPGFGAGQSVVDTAFVDQALGRNALVWDVRSQEDYRRGHIPSAVNIDEIAAVLREPGTEDYIPVADIERILGESGIDPAREIVLYGAKAHTSPYFGLLTLRYLGASAAYVYHGGIDDWVQAGKPTARDAVKLTPVTFKAQTDPGVLVSTAEVVASLNNPAVQIVDVRTAREFSGEDIRALRGGNVPGAVNIPHEANWIDPDTPRKLQRRQVSNKDGMNLKPEAGLRALYAGLDPEKETIVYCQSGVRAAQTAAVLQGLGFSKVKVYDSSWLGYGNAFNAPARNVTYFNVGRVNNLLMQMQQRIDALEAELTELKAGK